MFFVSGIYTLPDSLTIKSSIILNGMGSNTELRMTGTDKNIIDVNNINNVTISNLKFSGNNDNGNGIVLDTCSTWLIVNCVFDSFDIAIDIKSGASHIVVMNCLFNGCTSSIIAENDSNIIVLGCRNESGVILDRSYYQKISADTVKAIKTFTDTVKADGDLYLEVGSNEIYKKGLITSRILNETDIAIIKEPFWLADDSFPLKQLVYKDTTFNNIDSSNYIIITNIAAGADADHKVVTVNWLPYRTTLISPDTSKRWAILCSNSWTDTGSEPNRSGDATEIAAVDSADYDNKYLYCECMNKTVHWTMTAGDTIVMYNPFEGSWEWSSTWLLSKGSATWRNGYVDAGPIWKHSDGYLRMLINGYSSTATTQQVGIAKVHPDSLFDNSAWTYENGDAPVLATDVGKNRGKGVLAISVLKSFHEDVYIVYLMIRNSSDPWRISYCTMTEDGTVITDTGADIITNKPASYDNSASMGMGAASVVRYGSKYIMVLNNRDDVNSTGTLHDRWSLFEASADNPFGPFTCGADSILPRHYNNKISYRSGYVDKLTIFSYKDRIYALLGGTSIWHQSGSKANRSFGLAYRNERDNTVEWMEDPRSPLWINIMQKDGTTIASPIWGTGTGTNNQYYYAYDHSGGNPMFYSNDRDGNLYVFFACNSTSDDYRVWGMRLDTSDW